MKERENGFVGVGGRPVCLKVPVGAVFPKPEIIVKKQYTVLLKDHIINHLLAHFGIEQGGYLASRHAEFFAQGG